MRKTKLIALVLAMLMILTLFAGCGTNDNGGNDVTNNASDTQSTTEDKNEVTNNSSETNINVDTSNKGYITSKEAFVDKVTELIDVSLYRDITESDYTSFKSYFYELNYENKKEFDLDYKIKLGDGSEFTMPITFSELEKKGWVLQESSAPDREMGSGLMTFGTVKNSAGKTLSVAAYNPTEKTITFKECTVINVDSQQYSTFDSTEKLSDAIDFTICGTLTNASTLEDIIERLGNPYSINCTLHYDDKGNYTYSDIEVTYMQKSSAYSQLKFQLSGDGNYITAINYDVAPK